LSISVILACIGAGISFFGVFRYFKGVLYDGTKPRMASWAAWCTANIVFAIVAFNEGSMIAVGINIIAALGNALIIGASIRQRVSMKPGDATDWACLIASVACVLVILIVPENKLLGALLAMAANIIATIPTLRHAWSIPHEETWQLFAANGFASLLGYIGVVLISGFEITATAGPLITIIGNVTLVSITVGRQYVTRISDEILAEIGEFEEAILPKADPE
jgi:hypothetical protein